MGCHFLLQGIFPTQGSKRCHLHLLHWQMYSLPNCATWEAPDLFLEGHQPYWIRAPALQSHLTFIISFCFCCSATQLCPTLCNPMDCSMPVLPVLHYLPEFAHTHVHWVMMPSIHLIIFFIISKYSHLGVRALTHAFVGDTSIPSTTVDICLFNSLTFSQVILT